MVRFYQALFFLIFSISSQIALAQGTKSTITLELDSASIEELVQEIENQSGSRFYYLPEDFDSLFFKIKIQNRTIEQTLNILFKDEGFKYSFYSDDIIFLTKDNTVLTSLPIDFYNERAITFSDENEDLPDFTSFKEEESILKNNVETKLNEIGDKSAGDLSGYANIAGYVRDIDTGEPVFGALIYIDDPRIGVASDQFGYYSITIPKGSHELLISTIGMKNTKRKIMLYSDGKLDIKLMEDIIPLREIVIESDRDANVMSLQMGVEKLDINTLKQVPTAFGETDILRVALTLPGVQSTGENTTGLNVRGGAADQNLILYNDATIYNPSHLFGFFSSFNPDVLKNVELYKSGIPANYGGRLSSVLEIGTREGNKKKFAGIGGIGSLTTRLTLEVPIIEDKMSFVIGGRTTYSDWLLKLIPDDAIKNSSASFYDLNTHVSYDINDKNSIYLTGYYSNDRFRLNSDTLYKYNNEALTIKWKHVFKNKLYGVFTAGYSGYNYSVSSDDNPVNAFTLGYDLGQYDFKFDLNYFPSSSHNIDMGISSIYYGIMPGIFEPNANESSVIPVNLQNEKGLESAIYLGDRIEINHRLSVYLGLRYSMFNALGPRESYTYPEGVPKETDNILDTVSYDKGVINTYHGPEYRASLRYLLTNDLSLKLSYNKLRQYIHMLSNTMVVSPTDIWKLSDPNIKPQIGEQFSIGFYKDFRASAISTSIEGYYKRSNNYLDFKKGAELLLNEHLETDVIGTEGKAYGVELMVKKQKGKTNGWVSYTYSRSLLRSDSEFPIERVNDGEYYPSNYDKPHDFTLVANYKFNRRVNTGLNFIYSTGRPISIPLSIYQIDQTDRVHFSNRNQYRIPDYIRVDFSVNLEGNHKIKKLAHSSWTFAVYNVLGRKNPYSVFFLSENGFINGYKLSIFGNPIPTITYNFKF